MWSLDKPEPHLCFSWRRHRAKQLRIKCPQVPHTGDNGKLCSGKVLLGVTSSWSGQQGCWVLVLQTCLWPQKATYKSFAVRKATRGFPALWRKYKHGYLFFPCCSSIHSLRGGPSFHTSVILQNPGESKKQKNTNNITQYNIQPL